MAGNWPLALLVVVLIGLYFRVGVRLVAQWYNDPDYGHGFFVPAFVAYLIWLNRDRLSKIEDKPTWVGVVGIVGSLGLLFLGSLGAELFLTRVSLVGMIASIVLYFHGWRFLRVLAFPLAFLLLMVPLPVIIYNEIVFPLQLMASQLATFVLQTTNVIPILREGNLLILPNYTLEVVEACSGIRSLMSLITLGLGYGYLVERSWLVRTILVLAMIPVAVVGNASRVMLTAVLVYVKGPEMAEGFVHTMSGMLIFFIAIITLIVLHSGLKYISRKLRQEATVA